MTTPLPPRPDGRTRSIWLWQLVLALAVVLIAVIVAGLQPAEFAEPAFWTGLLTIIVVTAVTIAVPWKRISATGAALVPLIDIVGIGLMSLNSELRLVFLWVFPVAWIASYHALRWLVGALATIAVFLIANLAIAEVDPAASLRLLVALLCTSFIGITFHLAGQQTRAFRRLLHRQAQRLARALERVEAQGRRANETLDGLDLGIARVARDGEILGANAAYRALYGLDADDLMAPGGTVEYTTARGEAVTDDARTLARAARGETLTEERIWAFDIEGRWRALDVSTRPLSGAADEAPSTLVVVRDMTDLLDLQRERESIATQVSHELRNPITAIMGHADLLLERRDVPPAARESVTAIEAAGDRILDLVSTVLETSPASEAAAVYEPFDARRVAEASVASFRPAAEARGIGMELDPGGPLPLVGDAFRLRQAIDNVVSNAVKYTPADGSIRLTGTHTDGAVEITVADSGIGMAPDETAAMFEPYYRSPTARASEITGTGLGMSITRHIVEAHGGTIRVDSVLGEGTTVTIRIPAEKD